LHLFSFIVKKKAIFPLLQKKPVDTTMLKRAEELEVEKPDKTKINKKINQELGHNHISIGRYYSS
jgi:hypothetical protein